MDIKLNDAIGSILQRLLDKKICTQLLKEGKKIAEELDNGGRDILYSFFKTLCAHKVFPL